MKEDKAQQWSVLVQHKMRPSRLVVLALLRHVEAVIPAHVRMLSLLLFSNLPGKEAVELEVAGNSCTLNFPNPKTLFLSF